MIFNFLIFTEFHVCPIIIKLLLGRSLFNLHTQTPGFYYFNIIKYVGEDE